jgi:signal transduction histidine kinase
VSRIETGRLRLEVTQFELGALVRDVADRLEPELARRGCSLSIRAGGPIHGRWDRSRLEQVVTNLLSNAVKFGPGQPVEISIAAEAGIARIAVRDRGIGISADLHARIFGRFERAVSVEHYGGLGFGLYISRRIVEAHGGSIRVESELGSGSTFTVEIPCASPGEVIAAQREG